MKRDSDLETFISDKIMEIFRATDLNKDFPLIALREIAIISRKLDLNNLCLASDDIAKLEQV